MSDKVLITNYLTNEGRTLVAGTKVNPEQFKAWDDEWDLLVASGTIVSEEDLPALEEIANLDDDDRDYLYVMAGKISEREHRRRRLIRDGRSPEEIAIILGEDVENQEERAAENAAVSVTTTAPAEGAEDGEGSGKRPTSR